MSRAIQRAANMVVIQGRKALRLPAGPTLQHSIAAPATSSHLEGDSGSFIFSFVVTRIGETTYASTVNWAISGSANAADFVSAMSGSLSFAAGQASKTLAIEVKGDTTVEGNESFTVTISNPTIGTIPSASAMATILNDDSSGGGGGGYVPALKFNDNRNSQYVPLAA